MAGPSPQSPGALNWALVLVLGVIWGAAFMGTRVALEGFGPWMVAAGRTAIASATLFTIVPLLGQNPLALGPASAWRVAILLGIGGVAMPFSLLSWGLQHVPSAFAGIAMGAVPLIVLPLAYIFSRDEGIGPRRILGILLGFLGLVILIRPGANGDTVSEFETLGRLACLMAAACYASTSILTRVTKGIPMLPLATVSTGVAMLCLLPIALALEPLPTAFPAGPSLALLFVGLFPTALAAIIRIRVITTAGSIFMSLTSYMVPVWSVFFGITLLGEELPPSLFAALALILAGIAISQLRLIGRSR